jgi:UDP-2,4-diacetamido-2,4,6-trideoxy-beta-L-altropyranose hydrolase
MAVSFGEVQTTMKVIFRADGGKEIGMGHIMRSLLLADNLRDKCNAKVTFITKSFPESLKKISDNGHGVKELPVDIASGEEISFIVDLIKKESFDVVVTDSYNIDKPYLESLKSTGVFLITIDDLASLSEYPSDIIINGNIYASDLTYNCMGNTKLLLGTDYTLLRAEFREKHKKRKVIKDIAKSILITLGGSDPENQTVRVINAINQLNLTFDITVVVGVAYPYQEELRQAVSKSKNNITVFSDVSNISDLMFSTDIAISGGGITCYELACVGVPSIILTLAENQRLSASHFHQKGIGISPGRFDRISDSVITGTLQKLASDCPKRALMSLNGKKFVDGKGVNRIAAAIQELSQ